jgi:hypothetical protein
MTESAHGSSVIPTPKGIGPSQSGNHTFSVCSSEKLYFRLYPSFPNQFEFMIDHHAGILDVESVSLGGENFIYASTRQENHSEKLNEDRNSPSRVGNRKTQKVFRIKCKSLLTTCAHRHISQVHFLDPNVFITDMVIRMQNGVIVVSPSRGEEESHFCNLWLFFWSWSTGWWPPRVNPYQSRIIAINSWKILLRPRNPISPTLSEHSPLRSVSETIEAPLTIFQSRMEGLPKID